MKTDFKIIGFDADDTLWVNEPYYRETEDVFYDLLSDFGTPEKISAGLFKTEMQNLKLYGFGAKAFMLSMIETALHISGSKVAPAILGEIIRLGKEQLKMRSLTLLAISFSLIVMMPNQIGSYPSFSIKGKNIGKQRA